MSEADDHFEKLRASMREDDDVPPKKTAEEAPEEEEATTPAAKRPGADFTLHELGAELPDDAPARQSAAQVSRDSVYANMEQAVAKPGTWFVIATYSTRKTADNKVEAIIGGKQPYPDGHEFEVEARTLEGTNAEGKSERRHVVAARVVTE